MQFQLVFLQDLPQVRGHALADAGNCQQLLGIVDQFGDLPRQSLNGFGGIAVGTYAKRIFARDLHQIGSLDQDIGDALVIHASPPPLNSSNAQSYRAGIFCKKAKPIHSAGSAITPADSKSGGFGDVAGLGPFLALDDLKFNLITFLKALVSLGGDGSVVNENIGSTIAADKAEPLSVVEPFNGSL